jgi:TonB-dependent receptor
MQRHTIERLLVWLSMAACAAPLDAATITGRVYDGINEMYLEGVRVAVVETGAVLSTERSGRFTFSGLDAGRYTLEVTAVGYPLSRQTVLLEAADSVETLVVNISDESVYELEAYMVTGSLVGAAKALNQQKTAETLQSVISSDAFGQFVDRNAAEALQRMPGVTVEDSQGEGKFLIIRGANPAWNSVTIDGVELATPEENGRSIGLNIITVDQLESIEVIKTWLPTQKAGVVGGSVNLKTRSALDRGARFGSLEAAYGRYAIADSDSWRGSVTFGDTFTVARRTLGFQLSVNQSLDNRGSDTLTLGWKALTDYPLINAPSGFIVNGTSMDDYRIERERKGVSTKLELLVAPGHEIYLSASYNRFDDKEVLQSASLSAPMAMVEFRGRQRLTTALALELGLNPADPAVAARINAPQAANARLLFSEAVQLGDAIYNAETRTFEYSSNWDTSIGRTFEYSQTTDEITTYQLGGVHHLTTTFKLEWKAYLTEADKQDGTLGLRFGGRGLNTIATTGMAANDIRLMPLGNQMEFFLDPASFYISREVGSFFNYKDYSSDKRQGGDLDVTWTKAIGRFRATTRTGFAYDAREKSYIRDYKRLTGEKTLDPVRYPNNEMRLNLVDLYGGQGEDFLQGYGPNYPFGPQFDDSRMLAFFADPAAYGIDFGVPKSDDITFTVSNATLRDYVAEENIRGLYWMETVSVDEWTVIFGFRWENTENTFTNNQINTRTETGAFIRPSIWQFRPLADYAQPVTVTKNYDHILPALHLKTTLWRDWILRASYTQTIFRPLFTDLVPREIPSIAANGGAFGTTLTLPNFELKPMESSNWDISLQKYFEKVGYVNLSVFYKQLDGAIYSERREVPPGPETEPFALKYNSLGRNNDTWILNSKRNAGRGELLGFEFAYDRSLDFIGAWADNLGFNFNVAMMESEVALVTQERFGEVVNLFKQPDMTANFSLYYEDKRFFVRLSYNLRGKYLDTVRGGNLIRDLQDPLKINSPANSLDTWVDSYERFDLNVRWKLRRNLQLFAELTNLTNKPLVEYQGTPDRPSQVRSTGRVFFVGAKWNL